jgi:hypothetical protein
MLRARNLIRQPVTPPAKESEEPLTKGFSRLSPLALRMLVSPPANRPMRPLNMR